MSMATIPEPKERFLVVGIITSDEFQKCRFITNKLYKSFSKRYEMPQIRPMLDVEWDEYLTKMRRKFGNGFWSVAKSVLVFLNDEYIGDDKALEKHISKKYRFTLTKDWYEMGKCHLADYLGNIMSKLRQLAYITVSIDSRVIGTLVFELYNDVVPLACENFLSRCKTEFNGYCGAPIHRIMRGSWIQCGGFDLLEKPMSCENYAVSHDRRGVLSTCNDGRHKNNSTQFFITLAPAHWMDYNYVAFGQLIQGADVLKKIERVPTVYQSPKYPIEIVKTGELIFSESPDYLSSAELHRFKNLRDSSLLDALVGPLRGPSQSMDSTVSLKKFKNGFYWAPPGYVMPEGGGEKDDYEYYRKLTAPFFDPYYYFRLKHELPSSPGSSDVTI